MHVLIPYLIGDAWLVLNPKSQRKGAKDAKVAKENKTCGKRVRH
jgi:hypothetical protein